MELQVNNQVQNIQFDDETSLQEVVNRVSSDLSCQKKVICQLMVNDELVSEQLENEIFKLKVKNISSLKISAEKVDDLVLNSLKSLETLIPELIKVISRTSEAIRTGDNERAQNLFVSMLEAMEFVPTILDGVRSVMKIDYSDFKVSKGVSLKELEDKMLDITRLICEAQARSDMVELADILEYEMAENLLSWAEALPVLQTVCKEKVCSK